MSQHEVTITKGGPYERFGPPGMRVTLERTHPRFIHPTKGYREIARPAGTNRRRRPIKACAPSGSTEYNKRERESAHG